MGFLDRIAPKHFLCHYTLQTGCKYIGIFMCVVNILCAIIFIINVVTYNKGKTWEAILNNIPLYAFFVNEVVYCSFMSIANIWFIWGATYQKSSVVISWVVITTIWWFHAFCFVVIIMSVKIDVLIFWILALCFILLTFAIFGYFILIGYGYWLELKTPQNISNRTIDNQ